LTVLFLFQSEIRNPESQIERLDAGYWMLDIRYRAPVSGVRIQGSGFGVQGKKEFDAQ